MWSELSVVIVPIASLLNCHGEVDQRLAVFNQTLSSVLTRQAKQMKNTLEPEHIVEFGRRITDWQTNLLRNRRLDGGQLWAAKQFLNGLRIFHIVQKQPNAPSSETRPARQRMVRRRHTWSLAAASIFWYVAHPV